MDFYSIIKIEIMLFEGKWMELEIIMLSKTSQVQRHMIFILFYFCDKIFQLILPGYYQSSRKGRAGIQGRNLETKL